jgi:xylulokinase
MTNAVFFAGLDVSTQSSKLVVLDWPAAEVVHVDAVHYDRDLPGFQTLNGTVQGLGEGVSESEPGMWLEAVNLLLDRLRSAAIPPHLIRSLSVSGQQHGLVALTETGELARPTSKLWNDFSTEDECRLLTEAVGGIEAMLREVGNTQRTGYTAAKILHMLRHEPENYHRSATLFLVHNYINWYLTGGVCGMEPGDTSGTALWNPKTGGWSQRVIRAIDPHLPAKLPPVRPSDRSIGPISPGLADRFGLSRECTVDAGSGDNMYGAVGTGNVRPGIVTVSLGTSGTAYTFKEEAFIDPRGEIAAFCDSTGHHLPLLCVSNLSNGYNALLAHHGLDHAAFNGLVERTPPGNAGRLLVPWYAGERTPDLPLAAPLYFGFSPQDFTPEILARAVLEGHVLNLYDGFRRLPGEPDEIRLTGGLAQSDAWVQTIADIFAAEAVPVEGEGAALGAAIHAAWVWLKENSRPVPLEEITNSVVTLSHARRKHPREDAREAYSLQKRLYGALVKRILGQTGEDPFALRRQLAGTKVPSP